MKASIPFKLPVYKDQAVASNAGLVVEIGDTVTLVISNGPTATPTTRDVVLTAVLHGGRTIEWDNGTTGNLLAEHVLRVHAKHQYVCAGSNSYSVTLTEVDSANTKAMVTALEFGQPAVYYAINVQEAAGPSAGIADEFVTRLESAIQAVIGSEGFVTVSRSGIAGAQEVLITITGLTLKPGNLDIEGLISGAGWTAI